MVFFLIVSRAPVPYPMERGLCHRYGTGVWNAPVAIPMERGMERSKNVAKTMERGSCAIGMERGMERPSRHTYGTPQLP